MKKKISVPINLTPIAKKALEGAADKRGMTQTVYASRVLEWFIRQPPLVQSGILGHFSQFSSRDALTRHIAQVMAEVSQVKPARRTTAGTARQAGRARRGGR